MDGSESTGSRGITDILAHISEKPWSDYVAADYTVEQWHAACLIHQHNGAPTSKGQCKLPVRTPSGIVNRNGVYSAAAAMGGARGGVDASEDEKATAAHALIRLYKELDKEPPPALLSHSVDNILAHFGTLGMRWGRRKGRSETDVASESHNPDSQTSVSLYGKPGKGIVSTKGGAKRLPSSDAEKAAVYHQILRKSGTDSLSNEQLKVVVDRMGLEERYSKAQGKTVQKSGGRLFVEKVLKNEADSLAKGRPGPLALGAMAVLGYGIKRKMGDKDGGGEKKKEKGAEAAKALLDSVGSKKTKDKKDKPKYADFNYEPNKKKYADFNFRPKPKPSDSVFDLDDFFVNPKVMQTAISSTPFKLPSGPSGPGFNPTGFGKPALWK